MLAFPHFHAVNLVNVGIEIYLFSAYVYVKLVFGFLESSLWTDLPKCPVCPRFESHSPFDVDNFVFDGRLPKLSAKVH